MGLSDVLKNEGLEIAEETAKKVLDVVFRITEEEIKKSENKYDDLALAVLPLIKPMLFEMVEKINPND